MTDSTAALRHQMGAASDLQSVVRTMRALAAASIRQYEQAVLALADYRLTVNQGLGACLRQMQSFEAAAPARPGREAAATGLVVFGSDQGLVGQFNEVLVERVLQALRSAPGGCPVWVVGERARALLVDAGASVVGSQPVPASVQGIAPLVERLLLATESHPGQVASSRIRLFFNRMRAASAVEPAEETLLPLDDAWRAGLQRQAWPARRQPELIVDGAPVLRVLIRQHLFISLFQACAESLASENASRLAAMERADRNIEELLAGLRASFHKQRQDAIDEELFDLTAAFAALQGGAR
ncbi:MAG TPA: F0F1 ATP synthase subunit gamma [Ideonella sp.]|uniref:F0F1 ATP synthase subunit gamma n=1 Tax=Ideonella sp. TaxID=1929293 RepID=UPI002BE8CC24|nr:F0F1 ATP synthase subunit gamma [Ideonella sp.]HSI47640.1 F0F1 ATP synthase subunit gamma [Ideonella sp.]